MAQEHELSTQKPTLNQPTLLLRTFRWPIRRRISLRRRKLPTVRLGGGKKPKRGLFLVRMLRRMRVRWIKLQYSCMLRKLKEYYRNLVKDFIEAGATIEAYQQRLLMETSFAVPVMGLSFSSYPSVAGSHRLRYY